MRASNYNFIPERQKCKKIFHSTSVNGHVNDMKIEYAHVHAAVNITFLQGGWIFGLCMVIQKLHSQFTLNVFSDLTIVLYVVRFTKFHKLI